jgi:hypothetical protein
MQTVKLITACGCERFTTKRRHSDYVMMPLHISTPLEAHSGPPSLGSYPFRKFRFDHYWGSVAVYKEVVDG